MGKYFIDSDGYNCGVVVVENPTNPLGYTIIDSVEPPPTRPVIPSSVTRRQFKRQLHLMGLLETVQAIIDGANDPLLLIDWSEAQDFERSNPFVAQMAAVLGKTDAEIDEFFIEAKQL